MGPTQVGFARGPNLEELQISNLETQECKGLAISLLPDFGPTGKKVRRRSITNNGFTVKSYNC